MTGVVVTKHTDGEIVIRRYRAEDLRALYELDETCFAGPFRFDLRSMRKYAEERGAISLIACPKTDAAEILGFVIVHVMGGATGGGGML